MALLLSFPLALALDDVAALSFPAPSCLPSSAQSSSSSSSLSAKSWSTFFTLLLPLRPGLSCWARSPQSSSSSLSLLVLAVVAAPPPEGFLLSCSARSPQSSSSSFLASFFLLSTVSANFLAGSVLSPVLRRLSLWSRCVGRTMVDLLRLARLRSFSHSSSSSSCDAARPPFVVDLPAFPGLSCATRSPQSSSSSSAKSFSDLRAPPPN
jgi:hypothetical protein